MLISVNVNPNLLEHARNMLSGQKYHQAIQSALSKTVTTGKTVIAREIAKTLNLKIGDIKRIIGEKRSSYKDLWASIEVTRRPVPLVQYLNNAQRTNRISRMPKVRVFKGRSPERIANGLVGVGLAPYIGIFQRTGMKIVASKGKHKGERVEQIRRLYGPTAVGALAHHPGLLDRTANDLSDVFTKNVLSQIDRFTKN